MHYRQHLLLLAMTYNVSIYVCVCVRACAHACMHVYVLHITNTLVRNKTENHTSTATESKSLKTDEIKSVYMKFLIK